MGTSDRVGDRREGLEQLAFVLEAVLDDQHADLSALVLSMKHRAWRGKALVQGRPRLYVRRYSTGVRKLERRLSQLTRVMYAVWEKMGGMFDWKYQGNK
jgi:hypothetical protein